MVAIFDKVISLFTPRQKYIKVGSKAGKGIYRADPFILPPESDDDYNYDYYSNSNTNPNSNSSSTTTSLYGSPPPSPTTDYTRTAYANTYGTGKVPKGSYTYKNRRYTRERPFDSMIPVLSRNKDKATPPFEIPANYNLYCDVDGYGTPIIPQAYKSAQYNVNNAKVTRKLSTRRSAKNSLRAERDAAAANAAATLNIRYKGVNGKVAPKFVDGRFVVTQS